jgi:site-specific recombinase XerD
LAKDGRPCRSRKLGPSKDTGNRSGTVERVTGKRTDSPTVSEWLERWIRTERGAVAGRTMMRYEQIVRDFLSSIGTQAQAPLEALTTDTFLQFKERWLSGGRSPRTVNLTIKILKRPFKIALEEGLIDRNPVAGVRPIRASSAKKGVFSPEQILHLLDIAEGDWKGLILCGYFTGGQDCTNPVGPLETLVFGL